MLKLNYRGFKFDGRYRDTKLGCPMNGEYFLLLDSSYLESSGYYLNLSYERSLWENLDFLGKVYHADESFAYNRQLFLPGTLQRTPTGAQIATNGLRYYFPAKNSRTGGEIQAAFKMRDVFTLVGGAVFETQMQYDVEQYQDFLRLGTSPEQFIFYLTCSLRSIYPDMC